MTTVTEPIQDPRSTKRSPDWILTVKDASTVQVLRFSTEEDAGIFRQKLINQGAAPVARG